MQLVWVVRFSQSMLPNSLWARLLGLRERGADVTHSGYEPNLHLRGFHSEMLQRIRENTHFQPEPSMGATPGPDLDTRYSSDCQGEGGL